MVGFITCLRGSDFKRYLFCTLKALELSVRTIVTALLIKDQECIGTCKITFGEINHFLWITGNSVCDVEFGRFCFEHLTNSNGFARQGQVPEPKTTTSTVVYLNVLSTLGGVHRYGNGCSLGNISLGGYGVGIGDRNGHVEGPTARACSNCITRYTSIGGAGHGISHREGCAKRSILGSVNQLASCTILKGHPSLEGFVGAHSSATIEDDL